MRQGPAAAAALAQALAVSVPTLHRMLAELGGEVQSAGAARRSRHALRRALRGEFGPWPLYAVDEEGRAAEVASLALLRPQGAWMEAAGTGWPVPVESRDGWWGGLPYPVYEMQPQGYLGRQLARAEHQVLGVSANPDAWNDDDIVQVLTHAGSDVSGHLILGNRAFERWQARKLSEADEALRPRATAAAYARLAEQAVGAGVAGSTTAGEFPKFPALREWAGMATPHALVKFSGAERSAAVSRWADLLVCEHLALAHVGTLPGVRAARSRVLQHAGRTFLEVERFDRHGLFGRSPLISLATLNAALLGEATSDWTQLAERLHARRFLGAEAVQAITHLWWFGRLIANSDMHLGNLSFEQPAASAALERPAASAALQGAPVAALPAAPLALAPAYDMVPMLFAPLPGGEVPARPFEPTLPLPAHRPAWLSACAAAIAFWRAAASDERITAGFRRLCAAHARRLDELAARV